ncbi:hypothetical protein AGMMS50222_06690 [Endomicrobiia bacterium]|nr:hypothetical protein AGMMS50222_06690 [Endomicrobiia bacterium]
MYLDGNKEERITRNLVTAIGYFDGCSLVVADPNLQEKLGEAYFRLGWSLLLQKIRSRTRPWQS